MSRRTDGDADRGGRGHCALTALVLAPVAIVLGLFVRNQSGPLGGRHDDPKHAAGDWQYDRAEHGAVERHRTADIPEDQLEGHPLGRSAK